MSKPNRSLLDLTLAGLPELDQFPDAETRAKALAEIGAEGATFRGLAGGIAVLGAMAIALLYLFRRVIRPALPWPTWIEEPLQIAVIGGAIFLLMRYLHRRGFTAALREKLVRAGVPICVRCGYSQRGATRATQRCTECGAALDPRVIAMIHASSAGGGP